MLQRHADLALGPICHLGITLAQETQCLAGVKEEGDPSDSPRLESGNTSSRVTPPQQSIASLFKKAAAANAGGANSKAEGRGNKEGAAGSSKDAAEVQDRVPAPEHESLASPRVGDTSAPARGRRESETSSQQTPEDPAPRTSQQAGARQANQLRMSSQQHADHVPKQATVSSILERASPRKSLAAGAAPLVFTEATDDQLNRRNPLHSNADAPHASEPGRRGSSGQDCPAQTAQPEAAGDHVPPQSHRGGSASQPRPHVDQPVAPARDYAAQAQAQQHEEQCTSHPARTSPDDISDMQPQDKRFEGSAAPAACVEPQPEFSVKSTAAESPCTASRPQDKDRTAPAQDSSSAGEAPAPEELLPDVNVAEQRRIMRDIWLRQNVSKASPSAGDRGNMALTKKRLKREVEHGHGTDGGAKQLRINNMFRAPAK